MRPIDELATEICTLAGHINAASHRWLVLIAEFDRRNGWSDSATQSCAHWLNWKCGIAMGAAREKVRVARALENLPKVSAAMASGRLSYSKAREITRIACAATEDHLLMIAEHGTAQHVEKLVRAYRRCQEAEELSREARQQQTRSVTWRYDDDGSIVLTCRLPAEAGAQMLKALDSRWKTFQRERQRNPFGSARVARTPSPWWPRVSWRTLPSKLLAPIAIRSSCTWPRRLCDTGRRAAASSSMARRWLRKPRVGFPATRASSH